MKCKLLIADDEALIRESLLNDYEWDKNDINVVGCCKNGLEALDAVVDSAPDIVMTDIRMPGMSGLELLEKLYELDQSILCIILSGYCDFEYAKQAMSFGVKHYLTKPIDAEKMWEAIRDCQRQKEQQERYAHLDALSQKIFGDRVDKENDQTGSTVEMIRDYVVTHISDSELSLNRIAHEVLFMNVDYLSHLFVMETGTRFSTFLNESRIKLASVLLERGDLPVSHVAELVGCGNNPHYFSQLFKKYTGMTPTSFISTKKEQEKI